MEPCCEAHWYCNHIIPATSREPSLRTRGEWRSKVMSAVYSLAHLLIRLQMRQDERWRMNGA